MNEPLVTLQGLTLAFGPQTVLRNLDWRVARGQVIGLLGRNGAGKTSLLEALLGLRLPQAGEALLFGEPARSPSDDVRARIGYVPQQAELFEDLSAPQLLDYFASFYPRWNGAKVQQLLARWEIPLTQRIGLAVGRAAAAPVHHPRAGPRARAADPGTSRVAALDPLARRDFLRELVEQVLERATTVVFSTHILADLERVAAEVAFLKDGRIALQAPLDELLEQTRCLPPGATGAGLQPLGEARFGLWRSASAQWPPQAEPVSLDQLFEALA
jgi:ABC-2 type transport system ATP-binding protein